MDVQEQTTSFTVPSACTVACEEEMSMEIFDTQTLLSPPLTPTLLTAKVSSSSPSLPISDKQPISFPLSNSVSSFTQLVGITSSIPSDPMSVDFFELFLTPSIVEYIVNQTNLYISQMSSPPQGWKPCTSDRLHSFWGLVIAMGINCLPNLRGYWSQVPLLGFPDLISSWPYQQFRALLSCLHFNDKTTAIPKGQPGYDQLHKVRPFLEWYWKVQNSV